jgi:hypothetical protein
MQSLKEQIHSLSQLFPTNSTSKAGVYEIQLFPKFSLELDLSKYPKKPMMRVPKAIETILGDLEAFHPLHKNWNKENPPSIIEIIKAYRRTLEMLSGVKAYLSKGLATDLISFGCQQYPQEGVCVLKSKDGVLSELVLNPGSSSSFYYIIFNPGSVSYDKKFLATCHFHPTGTADPSPEDIEAFGMYPINIIIAYPYSIENLMVYNQQGQRIDLEILDCKCD